MIDPESIPRPCEFEDYFYNIESQNNFITSVGNHPPHSISKYIVNETENSSCRLIRSSLIKVPFSFLMLEFLLVQVGVKYFQMNYVKE